eukprot:4982370-Pleurochrysis_carterae.AAC.3
MTASMMGTMHASIYVRATYCDTVMCDVRKQRGKRHRLPSAMTLAAKRAPCAANSCNEERFYVFTVASHSPRSCERGLRNSRLS